MTRLRFTIRSLGVVVVLALMFAGWQADTDTSWAGCERHDGDPARMLQDLDSDPPCLPAAATVIGPLGRAEATEAHPLTALAPSPHAAGLHPIRGSPGMHRS